MISLREKLNAISELANEAEGDIPDLLDQCSMLDSLADEVDEIEHQPVHLIGDRCSQIARNMRERVQEIRDEMGQ